MSRSFENVSQVVAWRLCLGCGACISVCPQRALSLVNIEDDGLRPQRHADTCAHCHECVKVCPGVAIEAPEPDPQAIVELRPAWGNVLEVWEGYASDAEIRFLGSSGGVATALSLYGLEKGGAAGVLHIGPEAKDPLTNVAVVSRDRNDLVRRTGSRYAPAAPCTGLTALNPSGPSYVFVGKPCDVVALRKAQALGQPEARAVGVAISIFCAGTPSTRGTGRILEELGVRPEEVVEFRYRGCGWPGLTVARTNGPDDADHSMTYEQSWGTILSKFTQFRCRLCPDSTGELADISCGDPWYRRINPDEPGRSLVLVRTAVGRKILHEAMAAGYVKLEPVGPDTLPKSQRSLLQRRQELWGRLLALRVFRVPVPDYKRFSLGANWRSLPLRDRLRSIAGTARRICQRHWNRPQAPGLG